LPAYDIQKELFAALAKLPVNKESLVASGIGKVIIFYCKSKRPELNIKRQAEKLFTEWTRPILKRTDDYRKKEFAQADYDPTYVNLYLALISLLTRNIEMSLSDQPPRAVKLQPRQLAVQKLSRLSETLYAPAWNLVEKHTTLSRRATLFLMKTNIGAAAVVKTS
jgi:hypothetical protein